AAGSGTRRRSARPTPEPYTRGPQRMLHGSSHPPLTRTSLARTIGPYDGGQSRVTGRELGRPPRINSGAGSLPGGERDGVSGQVNLNKPLPPHPYRFAGRHTVSVPSRWQPFPTLGQPRDMFLTLAADRHPSDGRRLRTVAQRNESGW